MAIKTQETQLFVVLPGTPATVKEVKGVTDLKGFDAAVSSVESTTLASDHREYTPGIKEPGSASFNLLFDPADATHAALHAARKAGATLQWAIGWSDGADTPKLATGGDTFDLAPLARSFVYARGFLTGWDFGAAINAVVESAVGVQLVDVPDMVPAE